MCVKKEVGEITYCIFSAQYWPTVGGVENHTHHLARQIALSGDKAIIVTSSIKGLPAYEVSPCGVETFRVPSAALGKGRLPFVIKNKETYSVLELLQKRNIDRVIIQTRLYRLSLMGARFAKANKLPAIVIEHGYSYTKSGKMLIDGMLKVYTSTLLNRVYKRCPNFYAVSKSSADWLTNKKYTPKGVFPNAIAADKIDDLKKQCFCESTNKERLFEKYNVKENNLIVVYTGRLIEGKGILNLVQALQIFNNKNDNNAFLFIAGEGDMQAQIEAVKSPNIILLGSLPFPKIIELLCAADVFFMPTGMDEGLPSSILEAGACKTFTISTAKGGVKDIIPSKEHGILLDNNEPETLAHGLQVAADNPEYRASAAEMLHKHVLENFTYERLYRQLSELAWEV